MALADSLLVRLRWCCAERTGADPFVGQQGNRATSDRTDLVRKENQPRWFLWVENPPVFQAPGVRFRHMGSKLEGTSNGFKHSGWAGSKGGWRGSVRKDRQIASVDALAAILRSGPGPSIFQAH